MNAETIQNLLDKSQKTLKESMQQYISDPERDFIRNRKLPFEKVIASVLAMGGRSLNACG